MPQRRLTTVILAAGEGTRMKSTRAKVLHEVAHRPMIAHVVATARAAGSTEIAVVVGPGRDDVARAAEGALTFVQTERLGTAHAALAARDALARAVDDVIVTFGDVPLITPDSIARVRAPLAAGAAVVVGAFEAPDPTGYGRVLVDGDRVIAIREHKDASEAERAVRLCNSGLMALSAAHALSLLDAIGNENAQREFYLTDAVAVAVARGLSVAAVTIPAAEALGVNTRAQLAAVEAVMQARLREFAMAGGATLVAPETVFFAHDTALGPDTVVGPHVVFGPGVVVEGPAEINAFSHLSGCHVAAGARVGPFARIRPQSRIGRDVHIGNFVEVNRSVLAEKVEANHLAYLGDAEIGAGTNVGAGTITCNFDGANKHRTKIGADVFVGSNSTLVAPLDIGDEVLIAAGSTVTKDIPAGGLTFGRAPQVTKPERGASRIRANKTARAARKAKGG